MKKYICYRVEYSNKNDIQSIIDGIVTFYPGKTWSTIKETRDATFHEVGENKPQGYSVSQELSVNAENPILSIGSLLGQLIFKLSISDGTTLIWGSIENPVLIKSSEMKASSGTYIFKRESTANEL